MLCVSSEKSASRRARRGVDRAAAIQSDWWALRSFRQALERWDAAGSDRSDAVRFLRERRQSPRGTWRRPRRGHHPGRCSSSDRGVAIPLLVDTPGVMRDEARWRDVRGVEVLDRSELRAQKYEVMYLDE